jgi:hypothetical protein
VAISGLNPRSEATTRWGGAIAEALRDMSRPDGLTRNTWKTRFNRLPPDFVAGPFVYARMGTESNWRLHRIAEIIKFGLAGTDMPGHEYLPDDQVAAMAAEVVRLAEASGHDRVAGRR